MAAFDGRYPTHTVQRLEPAALFRGILNPHWRHERVGEGVLLEQYGSLLFEHRTESGTTAGLGIVAAGGLLAATQFGTAAAFAAVLVSVALGVLAAANAMKRIRCFETGIAHRSPLGEREVAYRDLRSLGPDAATSTSHRREFRSRS